MEVLSEILRESVSGGLEKFIGYFLIIGLILGVPAKLVFLLVVMPLRHMNIRKHGYPPAHCDADGDPVYDDTDLSDGGDGY